MSINDQDSSEQVISCPLCKGHGRVSRPEHVPADVEVWVDNNTSHVCHRCKGNGYIIVDLKPHRALAEDKQDSTLQERYNNLVFSVRRKFPNESRYETALRYIREAEENCGPMEDSNKE